MSDADDDIVDAEIVDDLLPALRAGGLVPQPGAIEGEIVSGNETVLIPMDFPTRRVVRAALAHFHDNGPRKRSTHQILGVMNLMADYEPRHSCSLCGGRGYRDTMRGAVNCSCEAGVRRRGG